MIIDRGWKNIKRAMNKMDGRSIHVGHIAGICSSELVMIAIWNHFGTRRNGKRHIPARRFHQFALTRSRAKAYGRNGPITTAFKSYHLAASFGAANTNAALQEIGGWFKNQIQDAIRDFSTPANAESTVAQKGFNDPLIGQTQELLNKVGMKVQSSSNKRGF